VTPPVLNPFTRIAAEMCAAQGVLRVVGYEKTEGFEMPQPATQSMRNRRVRCAAAWGGGCGVELIVRQRLYVAPTPHQVRGRLFRDHPLLTAQMTRGPVAVAFLLERGVFRFAHSGSLRIGQRVWKWQPPGGLSGARHLALQHDALATRLRIGHRHRREQRFGVGMQWRLRRDRARKRSPRCGRDTLRRRGG